MIRTSPQSLVCIPHASGRVGPIVRCLPPLSYFFRAVIAGSVAGTLRFSAPSKPSSGSTGASPYKSRAGSPYFIVSMACLVCLYHSFYLRKSVIAWLRPSLRLNYSQQRVKGKKQVSKRRPFQGYGLAYRLKVPPSLALDVHISSLKSTRTPELL